MLYDLAAALPPAIGPAGARFIWREGAFPIGKGQGEQNKWYAEDVYKRQVLVIVAREFLVTSLRLVAADEGVVIAANKWGKAKTVSPVSYTHRDVYKRQLIGCSARSVPKAARFNISSENGHSWTLPSAWGMAC